MNTKINYMLHPNTDEKILPFQYYNSYNLVTIPMTINEKKPFIKKWNKITETVHPNYIDQNIGILTGKNPNNITVLDIDEKDDGMKYWKKISNEYPEIITPVVKSPNGGIHMFFKYNKKIPTMYRIKIDNKKIGWDIKSDGSVVTSPPSMINKKKYKWESNRNLDNTKIISMPLWLEKFILFHLK